MDQAELYAILNEIFRDVLDNEDIELTPETTAGDVEGWDSFNHLILMVAIEKRFSIKLRTAEAEGMNNVGDLVKIIQSRLD
jgi:acyl carrier protein